MDRIFRKGACGALLDEYEQVIDTLKKVIRPIPDSELATIIDPHTADDNCRSLQAILSHVVHAGYGYATSIHNLSGPAQTRPGKALHPQTAAYLDDLDHMFLFTQQVFRAIEDADLEQTDNQRKIMSGWGQVYDIEQMMEHAIVHIMRHRRQIERLRQQKSG
ncbi:DinB family protein [Taibaiella chishuiensis]|uniref:DinB family protein n=1 Tax=Taibaiella chishuiensis TaxID=1434707 RepID=A0A2P8D2R3_9BACT|nr:DinB family protein [Taibaiella chishuiensis]PSK91512.1 DinB family protein [Taibaiella chishuiensis]